MKLRLALALGLFALTGSVVHAQETHYINWGGFHGLSGGWARQSFFADSGQLWSGGAADLLSPRRQSVRFAGGGLETRFGDGRAFLNAGLGFYVLESTARHLDRYGYFTSRYDVSFGMGGRLRLGASAGDRTSLLLTSTWLPRVRNANLPSGPMLSIGFGWSY